MILMFLQPRYFFAGHSKTGMRDSRASVVVLAKIKMVSIYFLDGLVFFKFFFFLFKFIYLLERERERQHF